MFLKERESSNSNKIDQQVMPELPEVETIRADLEKYLIDKTIHSVSTRDSKVIRVPAEKLHGVLYGQAFSSACRIGKLLIFSLNSGEEHLLIHLKMTGQLMYRDKDSLVAGGHSMGSVLHTLPNKYTHLTIKFADGSELFFNETRLFAYVDLVDNEKLAKVKSKFGVSPLSPEFNEKKFYELVHKRRIVLKAFLLNQTFIAGIGNIYADEICFAARVRPDRRVNTLTNEEIKLIIRQTKRILKLAIKKRGTTFNNYVDGRGNKGSFVKYLQVYGRSGKACFRCQQTLKAIRTAGRGTVFCPSCQR